jgi:hypothetical protein
MDWTDVPDPDPDRDPDADPDYQLWPPALVDGFVEEFLLLSS